MPSILNRLSFDDLLYQAFKALVKLRSYYFIKLHLQNNISDYINTYLLNLSTNMDFFDELNELALGSRLKRLSERFISEAAEIYEHFGLDVQPRWFTMLALLHKQQPISVVEAASALGISQPAITQFCQQLSQRDLINIEICHKDARRRIISLSELGMTTVQTMLPIWQAVQTAAKEISQEEGSDLYLALQKCENAMKKKTLKQRTIEAYDANL